MCHQSLGPVFHIPTTQGQSLVPHPGMTQPAGLALPSGKLRLCYQKWPIYSGFTHQKWWSAIVFRMFARGQPDYGVCPLLTDVAKQTCEVQQVIAIHKGFT